MTKKKYLNFSGFLNFIVLAFMTFFAFKIKTALDAGTPFPAYVANSSVAGLEQVYVIFIAMIGVCLLAFLIKYVIVRIEKNSVTLVSIVADVFVIALLIALSENALAAIFAGQIGSYITELIVIGCAVLSVICDLLSLIAEEWGHLEFRL